MVSASSLPHGIGSGCQTHAQVLDGDVMTCASSPQSAVPPHVVFNHSADYAEFVEAQFIALAMREGLLRLRGLSWLDRMQGSGVSRRGTIERDLRP